MNWMKCIVSAAAIAALCWGPATGLLAEEPKHIAPPVSAFSDDNPYAKQLPEAEKAVSAALANLNEVIQKDPFNFDAQIQAYYAYARAQARYDVLLDMAQAWEKERRGSFSGKVLSFDVDFLVPRASDAQSAERETAATGDVAERHIAPESLKRALPVAGATITLRPNRYTIMKDGRPGSARRKPDADEQVRPQIYPMPPIRTEQYSTTSGKDGSFKFEKPIPPDSYSMTVVRKGYETWHGFVEVPRTGAVERTVYLSQTKVLLGVVQTIPAFAFAKLAASGASLPQTGSVAAERMVMPPDQKLLPVAGAAVTLTPQPILYRTQEARETPDAPAHIIRPDPAPAYATKTDDKGHYRIKGLKAGRYQLHVEKDGLRPFDGTIFIRGSWMHQNIVLLPKMPMPVPVPMRKPTRVETQIDTPAGDNLDKPFEP